MCWFSMVMQSVSYFPKLAKPGIALRLERKDRGFKSHISDSCCEVPNLLGGWLGWVYLLNPT